MPVIKHIGVLSVAKVEALIGVVLGLIIGVFFAVAGSSLFSAFGLPSIGMGFGFLSIIILPIFYGIMMFISGAVGAFLYNVIAGRIGGIDLKWLLRT